MPKLVISTDALPEAEQFDFWREQAAETMFGVTGERPRPGSFSGRADITMTPSLMRFEFEADTFVTKRRAREIARVGWEDWIGIYHEKGEATQHFHLGREIVTQAGDMVVADFTQPFTNTPSGMRLVNNIWFLPRSLIAPHLGAGNGPISTLLAGNAGVAPIIRGYLDGLNTTLDTITNQEAALIGDNLGRLIAIGCGSLAAEQRTAVQAGQLAMIKHYIARNLADPLLSPGTTAAAHQVSVRRIHLLFEPTGGSFSDHVTEQRLAACHATLLDPLSVHRSVMDIAFAWGFNSLSAFYRGFARHYGISPRDLRRNR